MIRKKTPSFLLTVLLFWGAGAACPAMAQTRQTSSAGDSTEFRPDTRGAVEHYEKMSRRRAATTSVSMEGYVGGRKNNTAWGLNTQAQVTVPAGKKADITAGVSVMQSYYNGADFLPWGLITQGRPVTHGHTTDALLYIAGSYYPTSRLTLHGWGFVNLAQSGNPFVPRKGFSLGADYRISHRATLSVNATYIDGGIPSPWGYGYFGGCPGWTGYPGAWYPGAWM